MSENSYQERELGFAFPAGVVWEELDKQGVRLPRGMALVDLVIERENDVLLVEIKDPSHTCAKERERNKYLKRLRDGSVISDELVPKVRDSYTFLHLMNRDNKPFIYVVLLGMDAFNDDLQKGILSGFKDRLLGGLRHEAELPWKREHIKECAIMSVNHWNQKFADWPVTRLPENTGA